MDDLFTEDVDMQTPDTEEDEATEVPMMHLASFALHKLFSEWQSEGFEIPDFKNMQPPAPPGQIDEKIVQQPLQVGRTDVPEKANTMHPTTLLCMVWPHIEHWTMSIELIESNKFYFVFVDASEY